MHDSIFWIHDEITSDGISVCFSCFRIGESFKNGLLQVTSDKCIPCTSSGNLLSGGRWTHFDEHIFQMPKQPPTSNAEKVKLLWQVTHAKIVFFEPFGGEVSFTILAFQLLWCDVLLSLRLHPDKGGDKLQFQQLQVWFVENPYFSQMSVA